MLILDTALARREAEGRPIRVGMIGAGFMGRGLANQIINSVPGMRLVAVANRTLANAERAYAEAGVEPVRVENASQVDAAIEKGTPAVLEDAFELLKAVHLDCVVDVTGAVEFGARVTVAAIEHGKQVVTMNAELDGTVGPLLAHRARAAGVVLTGCDGDQPGVQGNLMRFVKGLGVTPLVAGNIKGLQDPYRTPTTQKAFAERWGQDPYMVTSFADGTKISFEQAIVANAIGLTVPKRGMHGWDHEGHVDELTDRYDVDQLRELGGVVDYVVKSKPGPGVFVLGTHDDPKQRHYLKLYKLGEGPAVQLLHPLPPLPLRGAQLRGARGRLRRRGPRPARRPPRGRGRHGEAGPRGRRHPRRARRLRHLRRGRVHPGHAVGEPPADGRGRGLRAQAERGEGRGAHLRRRHAPARAAGGPAA